MSRDKAIEAARRTIREAPWRRGSRLMAMEIIDAAAPHLKAEALREAADSLDKYADHDANLLTSTVVLSLRSRADRIERGEA